MRRSPTRVRVLRVCLKGQLYTLVSLLRKLPRDVLSDDVYAALIGISRTLPATTYPPFVLLRVFHTLDVPRSNRVSEDDVRFLRDDPSSDQKLLPVYARTLDRIVQRCSKEAEPLEN